MSQRGELTEFLSLIPQDLYTFLHDHTSSYSFLFIGGAVRDFFLGEKNLIDIDIEVRSLDKKFNTEIWNEFKLLLLKLGVVEELSFHILKLKINEVTVEFSPPRKEIFNDKSNHKNFNPEFNFSFSHLEASYRRDFSINAIGLFLNLDGFVLIDPHNGVQDLKDKILKPCSEQFKLDPVRWLRLARFMARLNFSTEIFPPPHHQLDVSAHYFFSELFKSKNPKLYFSYLQSWKINLKNYSLCDFILDDDFNLIQSVDDFFKYLVLKKIDADFWIDYSQYSRKKFKRLFFI